MNVSEKLSFFDKAYVTSLLKLIFDKKSNSLTSKIVEYFYHHSEQYISTMLVGNNIALVVYSIQMANLLTGVIKQYIVTSDFVIMILLPWPSRASSILLDRISKTECSQPEIPFEPKITAGLFLTRSAPLSDFMLCSL